MGVFDDQGDRGGRSSSSKSSALDMLGLGRGKSDVRSRLSAAPNYADGGQVDEGAGDDAGDPDFAPSAEQKLAAQDVMGAMKTGDSAKFLKALKGLLYMLDDAGGDDAEAPAPMPTKRPSIFDR